MPWKIEVEHWPVSIIVDVEVIGIPSPLYLRVIAAMLGLAVEGSGAVSGDGRVVGLDHKGEVAEAGHPGTWKQKLGITEEK